jgi:predicted amidohydrolase
MQFKVALCQLNVTADKEVNIKTAQQAIQVRQHQRQQPGTVSTHL